MTKPEDLRKARCELRHLDRLIAENLATISYEHRRSGQRFCPVASFLNVMLAQ
jgi:hypothetical protein